MKSYGKFLFALIVLSTKVHATYTVGERDSRRNRMKSCCRTEDTELGCKNDPTEQCYTNNAEFNCELGDHNRETNESESINGKESEEEGQVTDQPDILIEEAGDLTNLRWHAGKVGAFDVSLYGADIITDGIQFATHTSNCPQLSEGVIY